MNMLLVACGDTALLDRRRRHVPRARAVRRRSGHSRPRRARRRTAAGSRRSCSRTATRTTSAPSPHVLGARRRPGLRHAVHAGAGRSPSSTSTASTPGDRLTPVAAAADRVDGRPVPPRVPARHRTACPDCLARGDSHAGRHHRPHRRLQDRPDAARRPVVRPPPVRRTRLGRACWRSSPTAPTPTGDGFTGSERDGHRRLRGGLQQRHRARSSSRRSPRASTACSCSWTWPSSSTARSRSSAAACSSTSQIAERARLPARCRPGLQIRDSDVRDYAARGRAVPLHRLAGRADGGPAPHRHRRPPPRQARRRTTWWCSRRGSFPATRRPSRRVMNHVARRGADIVARRPETGSRVGPRQRRRAETCAVPCQATVLRADTRGVPATGPARPDGRARVARRRRC